MPKQDTGLTLRDSETRLLRVIRELEFGELRIIVQNGEPVRAEEIRKSLMLKDGAAKPKAQ
ncbi:MAG: YezD family protein [Oscillospiraceae bacterium]|nr:YezD family protein [Oscillospiraceae bacterium]